MPFIAKTKVVSLFLEIQKFVNYEKKPKGTTLVLVQKTTSKLDNLG